MSNYKSSGIWGTTLTEPAYLTRGSSSNYQKNSIVFTSRPILTSGFSGIRIQVQLNLRSYTYFTDVTIRFNPTAIFWNDGDTNVKTSDAPVGDGFFGGSYDYKFTIGNGGALLNNSFTFNITFNKGLGYKYVAEETGIYWYQHGGTQSSEIQLMPGTGITGLWAVT